MNWRTIMDKEIDISDEEEILRECELFYFINCERCATELTKFYNDITFNKNPDFKKEEAQIDLARIAITLNKQARQLSELLTRWEKLKVYVKSLVEYDVEEAMIGWKILDKMEELQ